MNNFYRNIFSIKDIENCFIKRNFFRYSYNKYNADITPIADPEKE